MLPTWTELDMLRKGEIEGGMLAGGFVIIATFVTSILVGAVGWAAGWALLPFLLAALYFVGGMGAIALIVAAWYFGHGQTDRVGIALKTLLDSESARRAAARPAPETVPAARSALPPPDREIPVTVGGKPGEPIPLDLIHGFDPRDLRFLSRLLENGFKFTETAMERLTLPYSHELMGKAEGDTPYARWMRLNVATGVIVERTARQAGKLAVTDASEIYRLWKEYRDPDALDLSADN